jgi:alkyl sulfatase BDS1-like metallo-beta-lactamase superfamily hydrolase
MGISEYTLPENLRDKLPSIEAIEQELGLDDAGARRAACWTSRARIERRNSEKNRPRTDRKPAQEHQRGLLAARQCAGHVAADGEADFRKYKYPPDQQEGAVDLVLQQAQALGEAWAV